MPYWRECPGCGAHLDPGEVCEDCKEKAAQGATNTQDGKAEQKSDQTLSSASSVPEEKEESQV